MKALLSWLVLALGFAVCPAVAQSPEAPKPAAGTRFYKLEFVVKAVEGGKVLGARSYVTIAATDASTSIRVIDKVQLALGGGTSFQLLDVGATLDCRLLAETQGKLTLSVSADISDPLYEPGPPPASAARQVRWSSTVAAPLGKPTVLFSTEGPSSKRQTQLELTATPVL